MTAAAAHIPETLQITASRALGILSDEIATAGEACQRLDSSLFELLKLAPPEARMLVMQEMHAVDLLNQHLDALRGIAARLGEAAAHADLISLGPVLGPVTLGEVVRRVEASVSGEACEAVDEDGDLDLF